MGTGWDILQLILLQGRDPLGMVGDKDRGRCLADVGWSSEVDSEQSIFFRELWVMGPWR